jgi:hypothetical protein
MLLLPPQALDYLVNYVRLVQVVIHGKVGDSPKLGAIQFKESPRRCKAPLTTPIQPQSLASPEAIKSRILVFRDDF